MIWRFLPLAGTVLFIGICFYWRTWLQRRRYGTWGIVLLRSTSAAQFVRDGAAVVMFVLLVAQATRAAFWPQSMSFLAAPEPVLDIARVAGTLLMAGGLILLVTAQLDLGASWRIGIEPDARPGLVTGGLYRFCRIPIFLGFRVIMTGYVLLLPTVLSAALLIGAYVGIRQQVAAEEAYLGRAYGDAFRDYARRVGRFLPRIGRLL